MTAQQPGERLPPSGLGFFITGILIGMLGLCPATPQPLRAITFITAMLGSGVCMLVAYKRRQVWLNRQDEAALRALPPTPQAELTRRALEAIDATPEELELNRQGQLSPAQEHRLRNPIGFHPNVVVELSPVQSVEGRLRIAHYTGTMRYNSSTYTLSIQHVHFLGYSEQFIRAFKRGGPYRFYFVKQSYSMPGAGFGQTIPSAIRILSGEALGDA